MHPSRAFNLELFLIASFALMLLSAARLQAQDTSQPQQPTTVTQPPPDTANTAPAEGKPLRVTITGVRRLVQYRETQEQPWKRAKVGVELGPGAEFRTGPRSAVRFVIPPRQVITLDRLGTIKVINAIRMADTVTTDLGMKYGRTRYDIEKAGLEHESTIHSPSATLAVRGTKVGYEDMAPFAPVAWSLVGEAVFQNFRRQFIAFGGRRLITVGADKDSAAATAREDGKVDPTDANGRTESEDALVEAFPALGGNDLRSFGIDEFREQTIAGEFKQEKKVVSALDFTVDWIGDADLNLFVRSPLGEDVCTDFGTGPFGSTCLAQVNSGGEAGPNDLGPDGTETIFWRDAFPSGTFLYGVEFISGNGQANFDIELTNFGQEVVPPFSGTVDSMNTTEITAAVVP